VVNVTPPLHPATTSAANDAKIDAGRDLKDVLEFIFVTFLSSPG